jgi:ferric-dicitrate binding protein FerR (iron transport regulator)
MEKEILYRFFEGAASLEEEQQVRQWVEASSANECLFMQERRFFDATTLLTRQTEVGRVGRQRVFAIVKEMLKAASVALLVLAGSYLYFHSTRAADDTVALQTVSVPAGQRVNLLLPDGTNVWLNARTKLTYPVSFNRKERAMTLEGEGYFEVAKDQEKPFIVHTSKGTVVALGTTFNIEDYAGKDKFEATLISGKASVTSLADPSKEILLTPDKKTAWRDGKLYVEQVDDYTPYRWIEGLICFRNESFMQIMKDFEKYYGVNVSVKNQIVLKYFYTGKFRHTDGIDYALRVLQKDIRFKYVRDDENQIIYIE